MTGQWQVVWPRTRSFRFINDSVRSWGDDAHHTAATGGPYTATFPSIRWQSASYRSRNEDTPCVLVCKIWCGAASC